MMESKIRIGSRVSVEYAGAWYEGEVLSMHTNVKNNQPRYTVRYKVKGAWVWRLFEDWQVKPQKENVA